MQSAGGPPAPIETGPNATAVAVAPSARRAFVASAGPLDARGNPMGLGTVTTVDLTSWRKIRSTTVGIAPRALLVDEASGRVFVVNRGLPAAEGGPPDGSLSILSVHDGALLQTVALGADPVALARDPASGRIVVVDEGPQARPGQLFILEPADGRVVVSLPVGLYADDVAVDPASGTAFVANFVGNSVSVVDVRHGTLVATLPLGEPPGTVRTAIPSTDGRRLAVLALPGHTTGGGKSPGVILSVDATDGAILAEKTINASTLLRSPGGGVVASGPAAAGESTVQLLDDADGLRGLWTQQVAGTVVAMAAPPAGLLSVVTAAPDRFLALDPRDGRVQAAADLADKPAALVVDDTTGYIIVASDHSATVIRGGASR